MAWFKLDDQATFHKKIISARNDGVGAWVRMGTWSSLHGTDGVVTADVAILIAGSQKLVDRLVTVGLLERAGDDYQIHDFLDYNPTAAEVAADREELSRVRSEAGRKGGKRSGQKRKQKAEQARSNLLHESEANRSPDPVPVPDPPNAVLETTAVDPPPTPQKQAQPRVITGVLFEQSFARAMGGSPMRSTLGIVEFIAAINSAYAHDPRGMTAPAYCDEFMRGFKLVQAKWTSPGEPTPELMSKHMAAALLAARGELAQKGDGQARTRDGRVFGTSPVAKPTDTGDF